MGYNQPMLLKWTMSTEYTSMHWNLIQPSKYLQVSDYCWLMSYVCLILSTLKTFLLVEYIKYPPTLQSVKYIIYKFTVTKYWEMSASMLQYVVQINKEICTS